VSECAKLTSSNIFDVCLCVQVEICVEGSFAAPFRRQLECRRLSQGGTGCFLCHVEEQDLSAASKHGLLIVGTAVSWQCGLSLVLSCVRVGQYAGK